MVKIIGLCVLLATYGCSGDEDRPGPATGGQSGSGGSSGADAGTGTDGGKQCLDDHTEKKVGSTFSCGGAYCIPGIGCKLDCEGDHECRPGWECVPLSQNMTGCDVRSDPDD